MDWVDELLAVKGAVDRAGYAQEVHCFEMDRRVIVIDRISRGRVFAPAAAIRLYAPEAATGRDLVEFLASDGFEFSRPAVSLPVSGEPRPAEEGSRAWERP